MNKLTKYLMFGLFALSIGISSCGEDNDGVGSERCLAAAEAWVDANTDFSFNVDVDTEAECNAWVSAFNELVDKCDVEDYLSDEEYQDYLDEIADFPCEDFL